MTDRKVLAATLAILRRELASREAKTNEPYVGGSGSPAGYCTGRVVVTHHLNGWEFPWEPVVAWWRLQLAFQEIEAILAQLSDRE